MTGRTGLPTGRCLTHRPARAGLSRRRSGSCRGRVIQAGTFAAVYRAAPAGAAGEAAPRPYRGYRVRSRCAYRVLRRMHTTAAAIDACGGAARPPSGRGQALPDPPARRAGRGHRRRPTMVVPLRWQPGYRSPVLPRRSARRARQRLAPTNGMFILTAGDSGDGVATVPPSRRGQAVPDPPGPAVQQSTPHRRWGAVADRGGGHPRQPSSLRSSIDRQCDRRAKARGRAPTLLGSVGQRRTRPYARADDSVAGPCRSCRSDRGYSRSTPHGCAAPVGAAGDAARRPYTGTASCPAVCTPSQDDAHAAAAIDACGVAA